MPIEPHEDEIRKWARQHYPQFADYSIDTLKAIYDRDKELERVKQFFDPAESAKIKERMFGIPLYDNGKYFTGFFTWYMATGQEWESKGEPHVGLNKDLLETASKENKSIRIIAKEEGIQKEFWIDNPAAMLTKCEENGLIMRRRGSTTNLYETPKKWLRRGISFYSLTRKQKRKKAKKQEQILMQ